MNLKEVLFNKLKLEELEELEENLEKYAGSSDALEDSEEPRVWHFILWLTTPAEAPRSTRKEVKHKMENEVDPQGIKSSLVEFLEGGPASTQTLETLLNTMKGIWARHFKVDLKSDHFQLVQQAHNNIEDVKAAPDLGHLAELLTDLEVDPFEVRLSLLEAWWNPNPVPEILKLAFSQVV